ncbi:MAG: hypothetical protein ACK5HU_03460 [Flavobacteriales bacterium]
MNYKKILIQYILFTIALMVIHLFILSFFNEEILGIVLNNLYAILFVVSIPVFGLYLWVLKNHKSYIGYVFLVLNGFKALLYGVYVFCFSISSPEEEVFDIVLQSMTAYFLLLIVEQVILIRLLNLTN